MDDRTSPAPDRRRTSDINRQINELLARQAGHVSYAQLADLGLHRNLIARRVANGKLVPVVHPDRRRIRGAAPRQTPKSARVYSTYDGPATPDALRWRGVLSGPPGSRLGHLSVLRLLQVDDHRGWEPIHVVHPGAAWRPPRGVIAHRTTTLEAADTVRVNGLPCTGFARSIADAAVDLRTERLDDILDTSVRLKVYDGHDLLRVVEARPTFTGTSPLISAIARLDATSGTFRSIFERRTMRLIERSAVHLPPAQVNVILQGFRPDFRFIGTRAILECDGRDYHRSPAQIAADEQREQILRSLGFVILRLRWDDVVYDEVRTLARIEQFVLENLAPPVAR